MSTLYVALINPTDTANKVSLICFVSTFHPSYEFHGLINSFLEGSLKWLLVGALCRMVGCRWGNEINGPNIHLSDISYRNVKTTDKGKPLSETKKGSQPGQHLCCKQSHKANVCHANL